MIEPDKIAAGAKSLLLCEGWRDWYLVELGVRMAAIEKMLLDDLSKKETRALRLEHRLLKHWAERPANALATLRKKPEGVSGNGAV